MSKIRAPMAALTLALVLLALLSALSGLFLWQSYRDTAARTHDKAGNAAQVVAAHVQWLPKPPARLCAVWTKRSATGPICF